MSAEREKKEPMSLKGFWEFIKPFDYEGPKTNVVFIILLGILCSIVSVLVACAVFELYQYANVDLIATIKMIFTVLLVPVFFFIVGAISIMIFRKLFP